ncbi:uncharacterized protein MELLADRAFT_84948 [Melampsora larici-populina 98AG31]|uniref:Uncharacterized protein n=1 Tax=Melampsora larici-populina (strain 98AG31 / pathotype 3-4-7) TaxID=747676 RepID=F4RHH7_MELLP|nr:uncharacterized protein MELLADRAFT_84948 [Melampsora larici-populina 98AG31]EGG08175.1 hypothetical protein MELLADRAFT_84948 [Melampsora larici-populina 98AG31]
MFDLDVDVVHGLYLSGNFQIERKLLEQPGDHPDQQSYSLWISFHSDKRDNFNFYDIRATTQHDSSFDFVPHRIYFLRGAFFPTNTSATERDKLFFEGLDTAVIGDHATFVNSLADGVGLTGLGRVISIELVVEASVQYNQEITDPEKPTLHLSVQHRDYHPKTNIAQSMIVEYRVPPHPHLVHFHQAIQVGTECQFHGHIKDFNELTRCYIVIVNRVDITSRKPAPASQVAFTQVQATLPACDDLSLPREIRTSSKIALHSPATYVWGGSVVTVHSSDQIHTPTSSTSVSSVEQDSSPSTSHPRKQVARKPTAKVNPKAKTFNLIDEQ